jgi:hypothetical protein
VYYIISSTVQNPIDLKPEIISYDHFKKTKKWVAAIDALICMGNADVSIGSQNSKPGIQQ